MVNKLNEYISLVNMLWEECNDSDKNEILSNMHLLYTDNKYKKYHSSIKARFREPIKKAYLSYKREMEA